MKILAIETSCDETSIAIIECKGNKQKTQFKVLGNELASQIDIHQKYGGVYPMMAKREHNKNLVPILKKVLKSASMYKEGKKHQPISQKINKVLEREKELLEIWNKTMLFLKKPKIDLISVTSGPGLEPALWVGISFAKALGILWDIPVIPVNHMEGHIFSVFPTKKKTFTVDQKNIAFPILSLLVSGGHTELVLIKDWMKYKKIGQTRDDASGEAFDKVARMLGLPYPGGPEISRLAEIERKKDPLNFSRSGRAFSNNDKSKSEEIRGPEKFNESFLQISLPRPMMHSKDYDFSFSGLKTAVLYMIRDQFKESLNDKIKSQIAREFEDAVVEVLVYKTLRATKDHNIKTLIVGGGVSANKYLKTFLTKSIKNSNKDVRVYFPEKKLSGDNALMIAIASYFQYKKKKPNSKTLNIKAHGNMSL